MKHIKRKCRYEVPITQSKKDELELIKIDSESLKNLKITQELCPRLLTEQDTIITAFSYFNKISKKRCIIPEPDPILIYFHNAQVNYSQIEKSRNDLLNILQEGGCISHQMTLQLYTYFGLCTGLIIYLFTAMEAIINKSIPEDYIFRNKIKNRCEEHYNHDEILRNLSFETKHDKVLTEIFKKNFKKLNPSQY